MFQGSKHVPPDTHFKFLESAGASDINGTTDFDRTNYFETLPSNQLELALWLESDRMGYLLDKLDAPQLANQQDVVRNERRQSVENRPVRHRGRSRRADAVSAGPSLLRQRDRLPRGYPGGEAGRCETLLQAVLHAEQRQPRHRGRLRQGGGEGTRRQVLRDAEARRAGAAHHGGHSQDHAGAAQGCHRPRRAAAHLSHVDYLADLQAGRRRSGYRGDDPRRRQIEPAVQAAGLRQADCPERQRAAVLIDPRLDVSDRRDRASGPYGR